MWETIIGVAGPIIGFLIRHLVSENKWKKVRDVAREIAKDPGKTNDPRQAIIEALMQVQLDRLAKEAKKVEEAFIVNGSNPFVKAVEPSLKDDEK